MIGDHISSLLFILSEEPLSRGLQKLMQDGLISPYKVPQPCPIITHLLYADDCLIFINGAGNPRETYGVFEDICRSLWP